MPNLVKKFRAEAGFLLGGGQKGPPPRVTRTQIYSAEDRIKQSISNAADNISAEK